MTGQKKLLWLCGDARKNEQPLWERHNTSHYYLHPLRWNAHLKLLRDRQETLSSLGYKDRSVTTGVMVREESLLWGRSRLGAYSSVNISLLLGEGAESSVWHNTHHWYRADFGCNRKEGLESWGSLTTCSNPRACLIQIWAWQTNTAHPHALPPASASIIPSRKSKRVEGLFLWCRKSVRS